MATKNLGRANFAHCFPQRVTVDDHQIWRDHNRHGLRADLLDKPSDFATLVAIVLTRVRIMRLERADWYRTMCNRIPTVHRHKPLHAGAGRCLHGAARPRSSFGRLNSRRTRAPLREQSVDSASVKIL